MCEEENGQPVNTTLESQLALLRKGCRAAPWACREFLSLAPRHSVGDVVQAVHSKIHKSRREEMLEQPVHAIAAIAAGAVLIRGWMD